MCRLRTLFAVRYYKTVAQVVAKRITRSNRGKWPETIPAWQKVAERFGYVVMVVRGEPGLRACCMFGERVILIPFTADERRLHRRIAHEVAHAIIRHGAPDGCPLLDWPVDDSDCHLAARLVEDWVDVHMAKQGQVVLDLFEL